MDYIGGYAFLTGCGTDIQSILERAGVEEGENSVLCGHVDIDPNWSESSIEYVIVEFPMDAEVSPEVLGQAISICASL